MLASFGAVFTVEGFHGHKTVGERWGPTDGADGQTHLFLEFTFLGNFFFFLTATNRVGPFYG